MNALPPNEKKRDSGIANDSKVQLFISHKHQDFQAAHAIKNILSERGGNQLNIFVSEMDISAGEEWGDSLKKALRSSRLLILIYTNPSEEWDWCLYETGLYTPLKEDPNRRVICFHDESISPPKPIRNLQSVPIVAPEPEDSIDDQQAKQALGKRNQRLIDAFLDRFFLKDELVGRCINPSLSTEQLQGIAAEIASLFAPQRIDSRYPVKRISIEYPDEAEFTESGIDEAATVKTTDEDLAFIGMGVPACAWSQLMNAMTGAGLDTGWTIELARQIYAQQTGLTYLNKPITGTFRGVEDNRIYRPLLYRVDIKNHGPFRFHVAFSEEPSPNHIGDGSLASSVFNFHRLAIRTKVELVDLFLSELGATIYLT